MNTPQITQSLERLFTEEQHRIVFWHDPEREFEELLPSIALDGVTVLRQDQLGALAIKIRVELEEPHDRFLIYAPQSEPALEEDWLLDIRLYGRTFRADRTSILLDELGLDNLALRPHITRRLTFLRSAERLGRLKKWVTPRDDERGLDLKMLAVLTRAERPDVTAILVRLLSELWSEEGEGIDPVPRTWLECEKLGLTDVFWELMSRQFGYASEHPGLRDLLIRLLVTDFAQTLKGEVPEALRHFVLPDRSGAVNASVFLEHWRGHVTWFNAYNGLSSALGRELKMEEHLQGYEPSALVGVMTFEAVEQSIVRKLRALVVQSIHLNLEGIKEIIQLRQDGHWTGPLTSQSSPVKYRLILVAIGAAAELLAMRQGYEQGFSFPSAEAMYGAYTGELYRFDQLYRLFYEATDQVDLAGLDVLKSLRTVVEACYSGWYMDQLSSAWGRFVESDSGGLLANWQIKDVPNQHQFYATFVPSALRASPKGKVFVIISDAFRFEAAEELTRELNSQNRFQATLSSQLGVLPSYTALGMAALLPHRAITYKLNPSADVLVDEQPTASLEQRAKLLGAVEGTAVRAEDLLSMSRDEGRAFVKDWRVVYIYHNLVDATGDNAATESNTFKAVRGAVNEVASLVRLIINNLNGSQVLVTADHGFLFQDSAPKLQDRSGLDAKPAGTLKAKKRYLLGTQLGGNPLKDALNVWHGETRITATAEGGMEFWVPKGANRFHFSGGARFVHGGAMLQEVVVPVISVKGLRGQAAEKAVIRKVDVSPLGSSWKVVNNLQSFKFVQTEAVSDRVQPRTLLISLRDEGELISNEVRVTFDSPSPSMEERTRSARLMIKSGEYQRTREYALVLRDAETQIEYARFPMTIDLAFTNDF